jgi:hypothetical protein
MTLALRETHVARRRRTGFDWVARGTAFFDMLRISAEQRAGEASIFDLVWREGKCDERKSGKDGRRMAATSHP